MKKFLINHLKKSDEQARLYNTYHTTPGCAQFAPLRISTDLNPMILDGFIGGICLFNENYFQEIQDLINKQIEIGNISKKGNIWKINQSFIISDVF